MCGSACESAEEYAMNSPERRLVENKNRQFLVCWDVFIDLFLPALRRDDISVLIDGGFVGRDDWQVNESRCEDREKEQLSFKDAFDHCE